MEVPIKLLEQIAFKGRSKREELIVIAVDASTLEGKVSQQLQANQITTKDRYHSSECVY